MTDPLERRQDEILRRDAERLAAERPELDDLEVLVLAAEIRAVVDRAIARVVTEEHVLDRLRELKQRLESAADEGPEA